MKGRKGGEGGGEVKGRRGDGGEERGGEGVPDRHRSRRTGRRTETGDTEGDRVGEVEEWRGR